MNLPPPASSGPADDARGSRSTPHNSNPHHSNPHNGNPTHPSHTDRSPRPSPNSGHRARQPKEKTAWSVSGFVVIGVITLAILAGLGLVAVGFLGDNTSLIVPGGAIAVIGVAVGFLAAFGFYSVEPNEAAVMILFGSYRGTDSKPGLRWANPLYQSATISLRIRNFVTPTAKVNDARGNPIQIAAVVVWRVDITAEAVFGVDNFVHYVWIQSESALRHVAREHPYDAYGEHETVTLIGDPAIVAQQLQDELTERVANAGVEIIEARITDLAYAPEIAEAMLRRQQAEALVAARTKIVEGATAMVRDAVERLGAPSDHDGQSIEFDADLRITFASNLMAMIVSESQRSSTITTSSD